MKYKIEPWKYSPLNTAGWEKKLNERARQGWQFRAKSSIPPQFAFFERSENRGKQYTVDIYRSKSLGYEYEEDLAGFIDFYRQLGWKLVYKERDGYYIFESDEGTDAPPAYQSEEERRNQGRSQIGIGDDVGYLFLIMIWIGIWAMQDVFPLLINTRLLIPISGTFLLGLVRSVINIAYVKGRGREKLIKAQDVQSQLFGGFVLILLLYSLFLSVKLLSTGEFIDHWNLAGGELYYRLLLILLPASMPFFLLGQAITLIAKKPLLGEFFYLMAVIGAMGAFIV